MSATAAAAPDWAAHLPPGLPRDQVDLTAGGSLPGAWMDAWRADGSRVILSTLDGVQVSADEFQERTAAAARTFIAAGLAPGARVLFCASTSVAMVVAYVGALRAGLTVVPANPGLTSVELENLIRAARPELAVVDDPAQLPVGDLASVAPDLVGLPAALAQATSPIDAAKPSDTALIIFTSGTTGRPKGVPLSHANLLASAHAVVLAWRWVPQDTLALSLPLFHVHGLGVGLHGSLLSGGSAVLIPKFSPAAVAEAVTSAGANLFFGVPTMYHRLAEAPELTQLRRLRLAVSGSAPLSTQLHEEIRAGSGLAVLERYGMTETVMLVSNPYDGPRRPGTVGLPLPGVSVRLVPREGGTAEIEVTGPNVINSYLDDPDATASAFTIDGWFRTGDLGELDDDGYLRISGRAKDLIITGGYNVYPREIEEVLLAHPGVADAAAVGAPSTQWGETVVAFVVASEPGGGAESGLVAELEAWCTRRLVGYKRPRAFRLVAAIPRNALGKIVRHALLEILDED